MTDDIAIVDAHHHFWDPTANYIPWLCDEPPIPFRYGDYRAIRKPYLPPDFRRDWGRHRVVKSVYIETEWDPRDPLGETRWVEGVAKAHGLPNAVVAQAWLDRADVAEVLAEQARSPLVRAIRHKPKSSPRREDAKRGAPARWTIRNGATATRCSRGTACTSSCRRRGGISTPRRSWRATSPRP
jgi:predicted TIM-barrel fold metal-dependent hydrolase